MSTQSYLMPFFNEILSNHYLTAFKSTFLTHALICLRNVCTTETPINFHLIEILNVITLD